MDRDLSRRLAGELRQDLLSRPDKRPPMPDSGAAFAPTTPPPILHTPPAGDPLQTTPAPARGPGGEPFPASRMLDHYRLVESIGQGGMGIVWKAWDEQLRRWVAVKEIRSEGGLGAVQLERFTREAQTTARLRHPNVVTVFGFSGNPERPYIVMDLIPGAPARPGTHAPREAADIVRQAAEGVAHAHAHGIIHRDLKPANILVGEGRACVTDFGLARSLDADIALTVNGQVFGTPAYMPPEQARGRPDDVGPHSDVYSLGATLYHLLTGRTPFEGKEVLDVLRRIAQEDPPPPRSLNRAIGADLEAIVLKAMAKEPGARYAGADELSQDLRRYLAGEPVRARRPAPGYRITRWVQRHPVRSAAMVLALVLATTSVWLWVDLRGAKAQSREAETAAELEAGERRCKENFMTLRLYVAGQFTAGMGLDLDPLSLAGPQVQRSARLEELAEEAVRAARRPSTRFTAMYLRGALHAAAGDHTRARACLEAAEPPGDAETEDAFWLLRGYLREMKGESTGALEDYDRLARDPTCRLSGIALLRSGDLRARAGDTAGARQRYEKALGLETGPFRQEGIRARIHALEEGPR